MRDTSNSLFIGDAPKGSSVSALPVDKAGGRELARSILHHIAGTNLSFEQATARLIRLAELAYGQRDYENLASVSELLGALPYAPARRAGDYYAAVLLKRQGDLDKATELLATINAPRALLTLGTIEECRGDFDEAARLHVEAMRAGRGVDLLTVTCAQWQLATIRAIEGDHSASLQALYGIAPLVRAIAKAHPHVYASWHNSLAVELAELGRVEEARQAAAVALASPIAHAYPEFRETAKEIAHAQPAAIAVVVAEPQQEDADATEAGKFRSFGERNPIRHHRFAIQPYARTLLNPRASPRGPPSPFVVLHSNR